MPLPWQTKSRCDVHVVINAIHAEVDDLRWVLVSNYRPFRPTRSTSRVIAENRFFNFFLFLIFLIFLQSVDWSVDRRPGIDPGRHFDHYVTTAATGMYLCLNLKTPPFGLKFKSLIIVFGRFRKCST